MYVDCGTLFTGDAVIEDGRLAVEDGLVVAAGPQDGVAATGERLDRTDAVVTPGFIDAHLHLKGARSMDPTDWVTDDPALSAARATADARRLVEAGFTTVRDLGSGVGIGLRDAIAAGEIVGPRVFSSGRSISQTGGHGDLHGFPRAWMDDRPGISELADGVDECRKTARMRAREGADVLKIMTTGGVLSEKDGPQEAQFTDAEVAAMVEEAHRVGMPVASHAQGAAGVCRALDNGVDTIEHGFYLDDDCLDRMVETDATFVPTLSIMHRIVEAGADHGVPEHALRKAREANEAHSEALRRAKAAGVPIAAGTDFIGPELVPHGENALELELLVEEGDFTPREAVESATRIAARTVPADDIGRLAPDYRADFLVLGSDPRDDIDAVRDVRETYVEGERPLAR